MLAIFPKEHAARLNRKAKYEKPKRIGTVEYVPWHKVGLLRGKGEGKGGGNRNTALSPARTEDLGEQANKGSHVSAAGDGIGNNETNSKAYMKDETKKQETWDYVAFLGARG